jgi:hypothetical protein
MAVATLGGKPVTRAALTLPSSGVPTVDVWLSGEDELSGTLDLVIGALTMRCTVVRGGAYAGASAYRLVGGAAGWRKTIDSQVYRSNTGVKLSLVLADLARAAGETLSLGTDAVIGPAFVRRRAEASRVLRELVPGQWWIDPAGVTQVRPRPASTIPDTAYDTISYAPETGIATFATEQPELFVPGATIRVHKGPTITAKLVRINLESGSLRVQAWPVDDVLGGLEPLVRAQLPLTDFHAFYEYSVVGQTGDKLDLRPMLGGLGLPDLPGFLPRPGAAGAKATLAGGSLVLVGFVNGDPSRPFVGFYTAPGGSGFLPITASLDATDDAILGGSAEETHLGSGSITGGTVPAQAPGRVVRWGDIIAGPASLGAPLVLVPDPTGYASPGVARVKADGN